jgi:hypothetical protein
MKTALKWALMAILTQVCTSLLNMFAAPGIAHFSDITPVSYASALIGAVLAGITTYAARLKEPPQ